MELLNIFTAAFVVIFVIEDPIGTAGVYAALTGRMNKSDARAIAKRTVIVAFGILLFFAFIGQLLLDVLHVSLPSFRIAGGLLLFVIAFRMIMGYDDPDQHSVDEPKSYKDKSAMAVFPLAIPLLAGPGSITAVLLLMTEHPDIVSKSVVLSAIFLVQLCTYAIFRGSYRVARVIGHTGNSLLARILGVLLAGMAVQFIADGVFELIKMNL